VAASLKSVALALVAFGAHPIGDALVPALAVGVAALAAHAAASMGAGKPGIALTGREPLDRRVGSARERRTFGQGGAARRNARIRQHLRLVEVLADEVLVERAIVVEVVASIVGARLEAEPRVTRALRRDRLVAAVAVVFPDGT
jgi:hypothetical protein